MTEHSLTPPPELRCEWQSESRFKVISVEREDYMIDRAAQWGWDQREPEIQAAADAELEACCEWLQHDYPNIGANALRAARRPKPPSLKEQAFAILAGVAVCELHGDAAPDNRLSTKDIDTIRRALEALSDDHH